MASNPDRGEILLTELQVRAAARRVPAGEAGRVGGTPGMAAADSGTLRTAPLAR